jgi:hypothetical protein
MLRQKVAQKMGNCPSARVTTVPSLVYSPLLYLTPYKIFKWPEKTRKYKPPVTYPYMSQIKTSKNHQINILLVTD